ncbi:hypothetical protein QFZ29_003435 [Agromyces albus]|nr:hypothetical protein [Agromyces albus]
MLTFLILMVGSILGVVASAEAAPYSTRPDGASHPLSTCLHNV